MSEHGILDITEGRIKWKSSKCQTCSETKKDNRKWNIIILQRRNLINR